MRDRIHIACFLTASMGLALATPRPAPADTVLSIGDSIGFGEQTFAGPSNGDRGYVGGYASYLAAQEGGVRPAVINLDIDGETTASFTSGTNRVAPAGGFTDSILQSLNTNYTSPTQTQAQLLTQTLTGLTGSGHPASTVFVSLGFNDIDALATTPQYVSATPAQQAIMLSNLIATFEKNEDGILSTVRSALPGANLILVGTYNPFPGAPVNPQPNFGSLSMAINQAIQTEASKFNGTYIDTYSIFQGNEAALTHITDVHPFSDNVHPNDAGYNLILGRIEAAVPNAASVPEPPPFALGLLGAGVAGLVAHARRRRVRGSD